jgi:hypothetical protein
LWFTVLVHVVKTVMDKRTDIISVFERRRHWPSC